jgi:hypothetical protein
MPLMSCPECDARISDKARFCPKCGFPVAEAFVTCPECNKRVPRENDNCPECGCPLDHARAGARSADDSDLPARRSTRSDAAGGPKSREVVVVPQAAPPVLPAYTPPPVTQVNVTQSIQQKESSTFAVVTLLCLIFLYPVGFVLNVVGLFTGPRRGCFLAMFILFVLPFIALVIAVVGFGVQLGIPLIDEMSGERW